MRNYTPVVKALVIATYISCAIAACSTWRSAHAVTNEQMDLDTMEIENIERDKRMQRMDDELQRIRDQLYYMREQRNQVPCGNCAFH